MIKQSLVGLTILSLIAGALYYQNNTEVPIDFLQGSNDLTQFCPDQSYRTDDQFNKLLKDIKQQSTSQKKVDLLKNEVKINPIVFSTQQISQILDEIPFTNDKIEFIQAIENFIPFITPEQIISLLDQISFQSKKLQALESMAPFLLNASDENKDKISNEAFSFNSDKKKARDILDKIVERNCLFGTVNEKVAVFVIDKSGSMDYKFQSDNGSVSRMSYVKANLKKTISEQLRDYQQFNIITFSSSASSWKRQPVPATPENIQSALNYIDRLPSSGGTNISSGLEKAFGTSPGLKGVYLLSDGVPGYGVKSVSGMANLVKNLEDKQGNDVKINTISFLLGGRESSSERQKSREFLETIVLSSVGGSFRQMAQK